MDIIKLWLHEASRIYGDKLIDVKDMELFKKIKFEAAKIGFEVGTNQKKTMKVVHFTVELVCS